MKVFFSNLKETVLDSPYIRGNRHLSVITGYASAPFILELLQTYKNLKLEVVLGMAKHTSIDIWTHQEFKKMMQKYNRLTIKYFIGERPINFNMYYWHATSNMSDLIYVGSANLTRNGLINFQEVLSEVDIEDPLNQFTENDVISCLNLEVEQHITFSYTVMNNLIDILAIRKMIKEKEFIDLPLTVTKSKKRNVHSKSGLNWGQREGRNRNQAYIPVPIKIHKERPGFFLERGERFIILTDDADSFLCVMAQDNAKAILSSYDNSLLGSYFRKRLGLKDGEEIKIEHLDEYGKDTVRFYKLNEETYFMDFDPFN